VSHHPQISDSAWAKVRTEIKKAHENLQKVISKTDLEWAREDISKNIARLPRLEDRLNAYNVLRQKRYRAFLKIRKAAGLLLEAVDQLNANDKWTLDKKYPRYISFSNEGDHNFKLYRNSVVPIRHHLLDIINYGYHDGPPYPHNANPALDEVGFKVLRVWEILGLPVRKSNSQRRHGFKGSEASGPCVRFLVAALSDVSAIKNNAAGGIIERYVATERKWKSFIDSMDSELGF
jgi:hypothetical protein